MRRIDKESLIIFIVILLLVGISGTFAYFGMKENQLHPTHCGYVQTKTTRGDPALEYQCWKE